MIRRIALASVLIPGAQLVAQTPELPHPDTLAAITERGRLLAEHDRAIWLATDAVLALGPDYSAVTHYISWKTDTGWVVAFGRLNAQADTFVIAYRAVAQFASDSFDATALPSPEADTDYFLRAARAITTVRDAFGWPPERPYNTAAFPINGAQWWVYVFPGQTEPNAWLHGGDWRYRVSDDGRRILESRQFHKTILKWEGPAPGESWLSGWHTEVLSDIVADTDVYYVLMRRPPLREVVATQSFYYFIEVDGTISCARTWERQ